MNAKGITPILNVSDMEASFAWFAKWGWRKCWDWGTPPTFGAVGSGECEIFLCRGAQGGRGKGTNTTTFQAEGDETTDKGAWMSVWVEDDVDGVDGGVVHGGEIGVVSENDFDGARVLLEIFFDELFGFGDIDG